MRTSITCFLLLSASALWAADPAQPAAPAAPAEAAAPAPAPEKLTPEQEKQAFIVQGYALAHQVGLPGMAAQIHMDEAEIAALVKGIELAIRNEQLPFDYQSIAAGAQVFFGERTAAAQKERDAANQQWVETNTAFLAKVDADSAVTKTASGLRYQILAAGADEKPAATSTVKARYVGKLCDGTVFDSTDDNNGEPIEFSLSGVIKGWTEGLQLIGRGGKIHLWVPAELGYGAQATGPILPGSVLEFEVELVDFK